MNKRQKKILEILTEERKVNVADLAARLKVSAVTIRKDLVALESQGIVQREHGFALLKSRDDLNSRIAYHYENKKRIASEGAALVEDGSTIMIESGSCCALLADELMASKKDLTIITNSLFIANRLRNKTDFTVILPGGILQPESQVLVGPMIRSGIENYYVDLFFIGTDGYSTRTGFTNRDPMRAQAVRDMATQAETIVVLTESRKFERHGIVPVHLGDHSTIVITDDQISQTAVMSLKLDAIKLVTVVCGNKEELSDLPDDLDLDIGEISDIDDLDIAGLDSPLLQ